MGDGTAAGPRDLAGDPERRARPVERPVGEGLLAAGGPPGTERMIAVALADVSHSPFYNLAVQEQPADKALVLLCFAQRTNGAQQQGSFRI